MTKRRGIVEGAVVYASGRRGVVIGVGGFNQVGVSHDGGAPVLYKSSELRLKREDEQTRQPLPLEKLSPALLKLVQEIYTILKPFLEGELNGRAALKKRIEPYKDRQDLRLSLANAYRKIAAYRQTRDIRSLIPEVKWTRKRTITRKDTAQERAMQKAIEDHFLCRKPKRVKLIHTSYLPSICKAFRCEVPRYETLARRVRELKRHNPYEVTRRQEGSRAAKAAWRQNRGEHPYATGPLSCVQADYWDVHCIAVDEWFRESVGRPTLCLATCITTKMPYGYYLSLEPPNAAFIGLTLFRGLFPKDDLLKSMGINWEWPVWGKPEILQLDNARDFRGNMITLFCEAEVIELQNRPVRTPHFSGDIENRFLQLATRIEALPGATGANHSRKRGNPSKEAIYTIDEFEKILLALINEHINAYHSELGMTPLEKWRSFFFDRKTNEQIRDLPFVPEDPDRLRIELLPFEQRTLGPEGVVWDYLYYDSHELTELKKFIPQGNSKRINVRRDPRDVSSVFVYSDLHQRYIEVPWIYRNRDPITLWKLREINKLLEGDGKANNASNQAEAQEKIEQQTSESAKSTRTARRKLSREHHALKGAQKDKPKLFQDDAARSVDVFPLEDNKDQEERLTPRDATKPPLDYEF